MGLSINNVSMDYFLRGVDAAKPKDAPPAAAPAQVNENQHVDTTAANAGKLVSQLDVLLVKAAKASSKSLDGKTIKEAFQKLVGDGVLSEASLELLEQSAGKATTTLKALNKFTGQQLATAFSKKGNLDASSKVGKVIKAAVDAQQELANLLAQFAAQNRRDDVRLRRH